MQQIWDMLDLWHYKLNELDAEVHDIVEQDSCHAQELMDILVTPLQQYQQVSQLAERRTAILNKVEANVTVTQMWKKSFPVKKEINNKGFVQNIIKGSQVNEEPKAYCSCVGFL